MNEEKITMYSLEFGRITEIEVDKYSKKSFWINGMISRRFSSFCRVYTKEELPELVKDNILDMERKINKYNREIKRKENAILSTKKRLEEWKEEFSHILNPE